MSISLSILALVIFVTYFFYFYKIITGKPEDFELSLLKELAGWMVEKGEKAKSGLRSILAASVLLESLYFLLVFLVIKQPVMVILTAFLAGFELLHLAVVNTRLKWFFKGQMQIKFIFNWKIERLSASFFFTHSMLVLISIIFF